MAERNFNIVNTSIGEITSLQRSGSEDKSPYI